MNVNKTAPGTGAGGSEVSGENEGIRTPGLQSHNLTL